MAEVKQWGVHTAGRMLCEPPIPNPILCENNGALHAPSSGSSGGNGVYASGANGTFPNDSYNAGNYWVDVIFNTP
jgi:hypothetical protein